MLEIVDSIHQLSVKYKDHHSLGAKAADPDPDGKDKEKEGEKKVPEVEDGYICCKQLADNAWPSLLVLSFVLGKARHEVIKPFPFFQRDHVWTSKEKADMNFNFSPVTPSNFFPALFECQRLLTVLLGCYTTCT